MVKLFGVQFTQRLLVLGVFILIVSAVGYRIHKFRKPSEVSQCAEGTIDAVLQASIPTPNAKTSIIHPIDIVVEPWQGRHNIYGVFQVPPRFEPNQSFVVTIDGVPYCGYLELDGSTEAPNPNEPTTRLARFRTRTALWLITKGYGEILKQPQNWQLVITKQP